MSVCLFSPCRCWSWFRYCFLCGLLQTWVLVCDKQPALVGNGEQCDSTWTVITGRTMPIAFGTGAGLGMAYSNCQNDLRGPYLLHSRAAKVSYYHWWIVIGERCWIIQYPEKWITCIRILLDLYISVSHELEYGYTEYRHSCDSIIRWDQLYRYLI